MQRSLYIIGFIFLWRETRVVAEPSYHGSFGSLKLLLFICLRVLFSFPLQLQSRRQDVGEEPFERVVGSIVISAS